MAHKLDAGTTFPGMKLTTVGGDTLTLPDDITTAYQVVLFYRGHWWPFCRRQLAAFSELKEKFDDVGASIIGASVDTLDKAAEVQDGSNFPIAYGVTRDQATMIGSWWEDRRSIIQPSEFILGNRGNVLSATYSTGPVGRLMPEDALKLIGFVELQKGKR